MDGTRVMEQGIGRLIATPVKGRLSNQQCKACGNPLYLHQGIGTGFCDLQPCQRVLLARVVKDKTQRDIEVYEKREQEMISCFAKTIDQAAQLIGAKNRDSVIVATTPHQESPLVGSDISRREVFEVYLNDIISQVYADVIALESSSEEQLTAEEADAAYMIAVAKDALSAGVQEDRIELEAPHDPILNAACASCKGHCCGKGGDTAFLTTRDLLRWRVRHPDASPVEAKAAYMDMLPEVSNKTTCVFQGAKGCVLTREMRADICNEYQCRSLLKIKKNLLDSDNTRVIFLSHNFTQARKYAGWSPETGYLEFPELSSAEGAASSET